MSLLLRGLLFGSALVLASASGLAADAGGAPASATVQPGGLIGLTRDEVVVLRGKPTGERVRADGSILMVYADGAKIELREGRVVGVSGAGGAAQIVGADGTRYVPGVDGNIQRPVEVRLAPHESVGSATGADAAAVSTEPSPPAETTPAPSSEADPAAQAALTDALPPGGTAPPLIDAAERAAAAYVDPESESGDADIEQDEAEPEIPPALHIIGFLVSSLLRFGLTVLVLRLALHFMGVPFFWPDLLKVALLYLAVHEVLSGFGELGGLWEFIPLLRLDEISSFLVLACALTWFKIASNGILALRIAVAVKLVILALMLGVGLLAAIVMSALMG